jgi:glucan-binding YG repeat protein
MKTGWLNSEGRWYFLNIGGVMKNTQALVNNSQWEYLDKGEDKNTDSSIMLEEKYKLSSKDTVVTGWLNYNEKWYYLYVGADMVASSMSDG